MDILLAAAAAAQLAQANPVPPPADADPNAAASQTIIVTGTRFSGLLAKDSPEPVQVVTSAAIERSGQPNLANALSTILPSFNTQAVGNDLANETLSARLRGLSPNHTLVLVNGKRRHGSGNLSILSSAFQGGAAPDLNFIPAASIKRIEVLLDGAAAQYGSDAIAGVVNIILDDSASGGWGELYAGQYYKGDGDTVGATGNVGVSLGGNGFINLSGETRFHDYSNAGGRAPARRVPDRRFSGR